MASPKNYGRQQRVTILIIVGIIVAFAAVVAVTTGVFDSDDTQPLQTYDRSSVRTSESLRLADSAARADSTVRARFLEARREQHRHRRPPRDAKRPPKYSDKSGTVQPTARDYTATPEDEAKKR